MTHLDPIIAVKDVNESARWYQQVFGFKRVHGGEVFATLHSETDDIILCLHQWQTHEHPSMANLHITPGNGLILYFRTNNMQAILESVTRMAWPVAEELHRNPNSLQEEFSIRDPDGYYLTVTGYHQYEG